MANDWRPITLGALFKVKHGFAFKGEFFTDEPQDTVLVTPGNFSIGGGFQDEKRKYYRGPVPEEYVLRPGQIVVTMTDLSKESDTLGYAASIPDDSTIWLHNQRVGLLEFKTEIPTSPRFVQYLLRTHEYRSWIVGSATGTTVKHTSPGRIEGFATSIPPIDEQRAIANILGTLDDKIELDRERNKTLEAIGSALFKDWFVDFGPVRAKQERRSPYLPREVWDLFPERMDGNELPEGWTLVRASELIEFNPTEVLRRGEVAPYLDMASLPTRGSWPDPYVMRRFGSGMRFRNGDTLLARITPCLENGKTAFIQCLPDDVVGWGSTEYIVMRPKGPVPAAFAYLLARNEAFRDHAIRSMTGTSGRQRAQGDSVASYQLAAPSLDDKLWVAFARVISSLFDGIESNSKASVTLAKMRDSLLPMLISGALRVKNAEQFIGATT
ncbi:restriction endonuclease subunit S [Burkholderia pseudomallei]|uniref:restriction endonuclease subunit S n=1 Tax=Burkholderia pseudomallei TaxID=28450 RepID=UPI00046462AC|nr:restriction endonuclease subunit S [Burkholderia pseudomallei]AIP59889.1 type I restriction modification DNA specificity domain protein [Burkholderia pseudomallei HBPUB10303a]CAJ6763825.1 type I restriction-modification system specificity determinant [Burkholderia pseudomallei]CAJ7298290.1 type I restriction-modification system specificity determinant [Burkholderia pseudomallei]CAJ8966133.1 type I restriction-modification system specificity determinant [Burkholderia pseudomallei]CAK0111622.